MRVPQIVQQVFMAAPVAALTLCSMTFAQNRWDAPRIVVWNCSGCHGIDGNTQLPYFPRLAALNGAYAEQRIAEFRSSPSPPADELFDRIVSLTPGKAGASRLEARINMVGIAHAMTAEETKTSSAWYARQKVAPGRSGNAALIERGKSLFFKGSPAPGLPACQSCHGALAEGKGKIPGLAGQNAAYMVSELEKFTAGDRKHAPEMTMVAQHGDSEQFRALAAYLQSL